MSTTPPDAATLKHIRDTTALGPLGIDIVEATAERVVLEVEVGPQVHQPYGLLHGGVSVLMSETCASMGAWLAADEGMLAFGVEINANHLRPVRSGKVRAVGTPIRQGRTIAVWDTQLTDEEGRVFCVSRCTVALRPADQVRS
jgi:uncharacterized protein (TIGR00369 family)